MKRFLLFHHRTYYPEGGMNDFAGDFNTLDEAMDALKSKDAEYLDYTEEELKDVVCAHIYDCETKQIVFNK